ncbi:hypothetical protein GALL_440490 [mine drainage metagenome]|uniref:EfeO-type cupredoxin-like domain-containing protein n=1 Tax=mine drainage metagenome TaxID=410659 RepID=A0A1J5QEA9_9ZZZZ
MSLSLARQTLLALSLALCTAPIAVRADTAPLIITFNDGLITPQRLEVPKGTTVTVTVRNTGKTGAEFESKRLHKEKAVAPGAEIKVELRGLPAGEYEFVDEFHENLATAHGVIVAN